MRMTTKSLRQPGAIAQMIKRAIVYLGLVFLLLTLGYSARAQMQIVPEITTIAGSGAAGFAGDGGPATGAQFNSPFGITADSAGNLYIADLGNAVVRKIDVSTGTISTFAGNGTVGNAGDGGPATSAELSSPIKLAFDGAGNLYIADQGASVVRKVAAGTGIITTVAGNGTTGFSGDGGLATIAQLDAPNGVAVDSTGNLYISDQSSNRIRMVAAGTGTISTIAGNGTGSATGDGGLAINATIVSPAGLAVDSQNNLYISSRSPTGGNRIRAINLNTGIITTFAGAGVGAGGFSGDGGPATSAQVRQAEDVAVDKTGNLYIADAGNFRLREVSNSVITTVAGDGTSGNTGEGGPATLAEVVAAAVTTDKAGDVFIVDRTHNVIRKLTFSATTFPQTNVASSSAVQTSFYSQQERRRSPASPCRSPREGSRNIPLERSQVAQWMG